MSTIVKHEARNNRLYQFWFPFTLPVQRIAGIYRQDQKRIALKHLFTTILTVVTAILFLGSCDKKNIDDQCISYNKASVRNVEGPNTLPTNQETDLKIIYFFTSSCGKFEELQTTTIGNTTTVQVREKDTGCICSDVLTSGQTIYKFKAAQPGIYYIKFLQNNDRYLTDTITVN